VGFLPDIQKTAPARLIRPDGFVTSACYRGLTNSFISRLAGRKDFGNSGSMKTKALLVAFLIAALSLKAADPILPDHNKTPGALFTNVTVEQICSPGYANGHGMFPECIL
jgi:hypothetical protein